MIKRVILFIVLFASGFISKAQQDAMFSHYMFNTQSINPCLLYTSDAADE